MANDILIWKYLWNNLLSDIEFRNYLVEQGDYALFQNIKIDDKTSALSKNKTIGTFYLKFGSLGHFLAYKKTKKGIKIYDPSYDPTGIKGVYAGCFPLFVNTVIKYFGFIEYVTEFGTVQRHKDDSFCQTWSLTYLLSLKNKNFKKLLSTAGHLVDKNDVIPILFEICKTIINLPEFTEYCEFNKVLIGNWNIL